jgi:6-phosphofructokinase 2
MEKENIPSAIINTKNETRENIIVADITANHQYRFGMPGPLLYETEWQQCLQKLEELDRAEFIVASGSLPAGVPPTIFTQLSQIAARKQSKLVVDTSGEALKQAVEAGVYLIKPNLGELSHFAGLKKIDEQQAVQIARTIICNYHCEIIVVSMGEAGALLVSRDETYKCIAPPVDRKSTVGAGDSMVAGIIFSLSKGTRLKHALKFGVACGTAATMNPGTELCRKKDALHLYSILLNQSGRASRNDQCHGLR